MNQPIKRALAGLVFLLGMSTPVFASPADPTGYWATGRNQAVTQIYSCGEKLLCGELVGFPMDHASDLLPKTWNHQPQCHFVFIRYLRGQGNSWDGTIINPRSGHSYGAEVSLLSQDQLKLRGFVLLPLLGSSRLWTRYNGPIPPTDCRMPANSLN